MIKLVILIFLLQSVLAKELKVGYFQLMPHSSYTGKDSQEGVAIEYFKLITSSMRPQKYTFVELPLTRLISNLSDNSVDIGLFLAKNKERQALINFPSKPLFIMKPSIAVKKNSLKIKSFNKNNIQNLNICAWKEGYHSDLLKNSLVKKMEITGEDITRRCLELTKLGRVDGFYSPDQLALIYELKLLKLDHEFDIIPLEGAEVGLYTVFSKAISQDFIAEFSKVQSKIEEKNTYIQFYYNKLNLNQRD